jgi:SAM-dependent methyltransferase
MADEVTSSDIARLAGVRPTAVSNWRRRHSDFPQPVGGQESSPTFALPEVEAWLKAKGRIPAEAHDAAESYVDRGVPDLASAAVSLLPAVRPDLVLDPICGHGRMLVAAARRFGPSVAYVGQDPDPSRVDAATRALVDAGARADVLVGSPLTDDALSRYRRTADLVICQPPIKSPSLNDDASPSLPWEFGPPGQADSHLAWLQICYGYLKPGGTAVVPVPSIVSMRSNGRRIRAEMLRSGALLQVVALPAQFVPYASLPWQLWVLERPANRPMYTVRLVDLSDSSVPGTDDEWQEVYEDPALTRDVASIELLDEDVLLVPSRHMETPVRDVRPDYDRLRKDLSKAATALDPKLPVFKSANDVTPFSMVSVMDLVRTGAISLVSRETPEPDDVVVRSAVNVVEAYVIGEPAPDRVAGEVLRCNRSAVDPYFLACFLESETNARTAGTLSGSSRLDLRRVRVPQLPLADQQRYGDAYRRLTALTEQADELSTLARRAVRTAVNGLTSGVLLP